MLPEQAILDVETMVIDVEKYFSCGKLDPDWRRRVVVEIAQSDIILSELEARHSMKIHILSEKQILTASRLRNQVQMLKDKILSDRFS
jgi:hypothetical protein